MSMIVIRFQALMYSRTNSIKDTVNFKIFHKLILTDLKVIRLILFIVPLSNNVLKLEVQGVIWSRIIIFIKKC